MMFLQGGYSRETEAAQLSLRGVIISQWRGRLAESHTAALRRQPGQWAVSGQPWGEILEGQHRARIPGVYLAHANELLLSI